ncbi:hypothetical protein QOZ80_6AG0513060 [Eleusine coracana subsp. coracana]|nr:hypothetical protein QOZ80_6AG0513060 [Eleusine coracana subsp. coracana]
MRIRRRPQASLQPQQASDPATSASPSQTPQNAAGNRGCLDGDDEDEGRPHANADLGAQKSGVARRLALPQNNAVDSDASVGAGQGAGGELHMRCSTVENGDHGSDQEDSVTWTGAVGSNKPALLVLAAAKVEHASNGIVLPVAPPEEKVVSNGGANTKKRRGPPVLLEGSRCSRVNGRGWRCSQSTLVGYMLCEHHLGKGRARSSSSGAAAAGGPRGGPGQLGRTEHGPRRVHPTSATTVTIAAAAPSAEGRPGLPHC